MEKGGMKYAAAGDRTRVSPVWLCFGNHWARQAVLIGKGLRLLLDRHQVEQLCCKQRRRRRRRGRRRQPVGTGTPAGVRKGVRMHASTRGGRGARARAVARLGAMSSAANGSSSYGDTGKGRVHAGARTSSASELRKHDKGEPARGHKNTHGQTTLHK